MPTDDAFASNESSIADRSYQVERGVETMPPGFWMFEHAHAYDL